MALSLAWWRRRVGGALVATFACGLACSTLPDIPAGTCGNHVLEANEDCDTSAVGADNTSCRAPGQIGACHYDCASDTTGGPFVCPAGFGCGHDGICRAAKGVFQPASGQISSNAVALGMSDYNGDGLLDVRESTQADTRIRFGSDTGDFSSFFRVPTGDPHPATGALSTDKLSDLAFAFQNKVAVWRGTTDDTLQPTPYPAFPIQGFQVFFLPTKVQVTHAGSQIVIFASGDKIVPPFIAFRDTVSTEASDDGNGNFILAEAGQSPENFAGKPRALKLNEQVPCDDLVWAFKNEAAIHVLQTCQSGDPTKPNLLCASTGTAKDTLCTVLPGASNRKKSDAYLEPKDIALPAGSSVGKGFHVADLDRDGHLDLLVEVLVEGEAHVVQVLGRGDGTFAPVTSLDATNDVTTYYGAFPLAVGQLTINDALPDYVTPTGIVFNARSPYLDGGAPEASTGDGGDGGGDAGTLGGIVPPKTQAAPDGVTWTAALISDVNANGFADVVCGADGEVDFYNGTGNSLVDRFSFPIQGSAGLLALGDFDGDLATDIAFRQHDTATNTDGISIMWGHILAPPEPPATVGTLGEIDSVEPGILDDPTEVSLSGIHSIGVLVRLAGSTDQFIAVLAGSSDRQLQSPYGLSRANPDPLARGTGQFLHGNALALGVGRFSTGGPTAHPDVAAIALDAPDDPRAPTPNVVRAWLVPSTGDAQLAATATASDPPLDTNGSSSTLVWSGAQNTSVDLDAPSAGQQDELITLVPPIETSNTKGALFVGRVTGGAFHYDSKSRIDVGVAVSGGVKWKLARADLNGDRALDVIVFADTNDGPRALVFLNKASGGLDPTPVVVPVPAGAHVLSVTAVQADADAQEEIALLTDLGVFLADPAADASSFTVGGKLAGLPGAPVGATSAAIAAGDVTGDGVDDLAIVSKGALQIFQGIPVNK